MEAIPIHKWTNGGDSVLVLRYINDDGTSFGGFQNPTETGAIISAPDWEPTKKCGNGLHGWAWGLGRSGKCTSVTKGLWQVVSADADAGIDLGGKAKWPRFCVVYTGTIQECDALLFEGRLRWIAQYSSSASSSGDYSSASSSGYYSSASSSGYSSSASSSGYYSSASSSGNCSSASSSGNCSSASSSGYCSSASSSGYSSSASSSGDSSSAVAGLDGRAASGPHGCIAIAWWNETEERREMVCAEIGVGDGSDGKLKAHTWYQIDRNRNFIEQDGAH